MNKNITLVLILVIVILGGYFLFQSNPNSEVTSADNNMMQDSEKMMGDETTMMAETTIVTYANNVFSPSEVKIKVGNTVKFVNNGTSDIQVSSGPHPTHTSYPALESGRLAPEASYEFTATEKITINYHNHLNAKATGKIVVE